ncbi:MAG: hypothetical protein V9E94_05465 [Microthrixaceae bacterium]
MAFDHACLGVGQPDSQRCRLGHRVGQRRVEIRDAGIDLLTLPDELAGPLPERHLLVVQIRDGPPIPGDLVPGRLDRLVDGEREAGDGVRDLGDAAQHVDR